MSTRFEPSTIPQEYVPLCVPEIRGNAWDYVRQCLDDNWVSSVGPFVERFERMTADYVGAGFGVATVNGTAALHTALLVAGVNPDDEVLVSALTFIASANAVRYVGAWPVLIDAEPDYWQIDPQRVIDFLSTSCNWCNGALWNKSTRRRVKAVLPVHILGHPVDMDPILEVAKKYDLVVIEDAAESLGATYKGKPVGSLGDIGCFSFNGNKIITTGGGGMLVTDNMVYAQRARYLTTQAKDDPLEYIHCELGYNYRLTNLQASLGCAQMEQLADYVQIKRQIALHYRAAFSTMTGLRPMSEAPWARSSYWLYTVLVDEHRFGMCNRELLKWLDHCGIQSRPLWQPLHRSPSFANLPRYDCPVADRLSRTALSIPSSAGLGDKQQLVIDAIRSAKAGNRRSA